MGNEPTNDGKYPTYRWMMEFEEKLLNKIDKRMIVVESISGRIASNEADMERLETKHAKCSNETNQRLERIENLLNKGKNVVLKWAGKGFVVGYRALALYLLYRLTSINPDLATAAQNILLP